ncbi:putative MO25-like protein At5g47540 [Ziziphus jujuba]|uniref:MO25-like protein At5g47540 n=1 Tax=Ziziphus jujuba TaxID=326968 RepID=A0A6P3ZPM6_ZIZJJ|nr:putative MO25-like protein At5g47540 [Ziziphus jujuba]
MKGLFKSKPRSPVELVRHLRELLIFVKENKEPREHKREEKMTELSKTILEIRTVLYGTGETEPNPEACSQLTSEFFKEDTFRLLINCLPKLNLGARQDSTRVVANLQRQRVSSRLIASDYLETNMDLMDILIPGYEDSEIALTYGAIARECIRHQTVAKYVLESEHMKKFFDYIQVPNFEIASDAAATFKELLTRHKSTVAEFLSKNYDWFFKEYNSQLLESPSYITKRHAVKLLGDMLLDRSNSAVMVRYVSSLAHMRILMNLLRDSNKTIQLETFHVFKLFVANQNKPPEIINVLVTNRSKFLRFFRDFNVDKDNEHFEADKAQVINEIIILEPRDPPCTDLDKGEVPC